MGGQKLGGVRHPSPFTLHPSPFDYFVGMLREGCFPSAPSGCASRGTMSRREDPRRARVSAREEIGLNYLEPHLESRPNSMCALYVHLAAAWKALLNDNS